ncbi:TPA: hypothetical protein ACPJ2O_004434 [Vibrio diabolicus]
MKSHRIFQLVGLYGVLFLIPIIQFQLNSYSSSEDYHQRKQIQNVVNHMYYDVKALVCETLGAEFTTHDCNKGIYQDRLLNFNSTQEHESAEKKNVITLRYWILYYFVAFMGFVGSYIEYRREFKEQASSSKLASIENDLSKLSSLFENGYLNAEQFEKAKNELLLCVDKN